MKLRHGLVVAGCLLAVAATAEEAGPSFRKIKVTDKFWSEGVATGDFNRDGAFDVCAGPFWYEGPAFTVRHDYRPATATFKGRTPDGRAGDIEGYAGALSTVNAYSDDFIAFARDFNGDGWIDILAIGLPGTAATWYENPQGKAGHWTGHRVLDVVDNESPIMGDVDRDGVPDLICGNGGYLGYARADATDATKPWTYHRISPKGTWHKYTHGVGLGDINGDGRPDLLLADGWWEQPASREGDPVWKQHAFKFAAGGAQMFVYDVNGDGLNDVITCLDPHLYGLVWWEQSNKPGEAEFIKHVIMGSKPADNRFGVAFSQPHAMELFDVDGDGLKDLVTGKRFWAHGPAGDVEPNEAAVLYWFQLVRDPKDKSAEFVPHLVDKDSGVGTQVALTPAGDIAVSNKRGTFVFVREAKAGAR